MNLRRLCLVCAAVLLASCSDRAQELEEKVTQLQRQLDQTEKKLQASNQELNTRAANATATPASAVSSTGLASREAVEQSYAASVAAFRKELDSKLKDFRVESCTTHSVQMPSEFFPFTSQISLALLSNDGKTFSTDIPLKADATGKWIFPSVSEVTQRIEKAGQMASTGGGQAPSSQRKTAPATDQPAPYMKVDGTYVIQWSETPAAPPVSPRTPAPVEAAPAPRIAVPPPRIAAPPPAQPTRSSPAASPAAPRGAMPSDRDVQIQFPSPP